MLKIITGTANRQLRHGKDIYPKGESIVGVNYFPTFEYLSTHNGIAVTNTIEIDDYESLSQEEIDGFIVKDITQEKLVLFDKTKDKEIELFCE